MKPIYSIDAPFRGILDVIQAQTVPLLGKCRVEGRTQVYSQNGLDRNYFFSTLRPAGGTVMIDSLREIHIKICPARIVMYSQRRVC
jgi:hypothetical protein